MTEAWAVVENGVVVEAHDATLIVPWWSVTKTVIATAALVLVRDGAAALDDPMQDRPYTLRHLLQHRSGLVDYGGNDFYHAAVARGEDPWPLPTLLNQIDADRLRYTTGEGWDYSNIGYLFVRQLIESLTGDKLDVALRRLVLNPLGIDSAKIVQERADLEAVVMGRARTYHPGWVYHGLMVGSVGDAAIFIDRLMAGDLLPSEQLTNMLTPFRLPGPIPGRPWAAPGYGLGVMTAETMAGTKVAGHTGGGPGSTIAAYHSLPGGFARTAALFATSEDQARTEEKTFAFLAR